MAPTLWNSMALRQAVAVMLIALLVGIAVGALKLLSSFQEERRRLRDTVEQILDVVAAPAASALWNLDEPAGALVIGAALSIPEVQGVELRESQGRIVLERWRSRSVDGAGATLFSEVLAGTRTLEWRRPNGDLAPVGEVSVRLDGGRVFQAFIDRTRAEMVSVLVQSAILGIVIGIGFHFYFVRPLMRLGRRISHVQFSGLEDALIEPPPGHQQDEMGFLARRFTEVLNGLQRSQSQLRQLATRDSLTGLPNRALILETLEHALLRARRAQACTAIFFLDLDRFKHVNDTMGHTAGDELLCHVGARLRDSVRTADVVGRLGGDEFVVLSEGLASRQEAVIIAARIAAAMEAPVQLGPGTVKPCVSIGIAVAPDHGDDRETLMRHADRAMYAAKSEGGSTWRFFEPEMLEGAGDRMRLENDLRMAIALKDFVPFYQPIMAADQRTMVAVEALVRWRRGGAMVPPSVFLPLAEETGLIVDIGRQVMEASFADLAEWHRRGARLDLSVNISARQLANPDIVDHIKLALENSRADRRHVILEITESVMMGDLERNRRTLAELRRLGLRIAIDDFGTGYSSLAYVRHLPATALKIDRAFIQGLPHDHTIATVVIQLARGYGLRTVAEGVETQDQADWLARNGVDFLQGYLYGTPVPAEVLARDWLKVA